MYVKLCSRRDRFPSYELRGRLGIDDMIFVLQRNRLRLYGHVLWKEDNDWVNKCTEYEVEGPRPRRRPERTLREVVEKDCQAHKLNKEDAMDCSRWEKLIKDGWWSGWVSVGDCFFWYWPTQVVLDKGPLNGCLCVCRERLFPVRTLIRCWPPPIVVSTSGGRCLLVTTATTATC